MSTNLAIAAAASRQHQLAPRTRQTLRVIGAVMLMLMCLCAWFVLHALGEPATRTPLLSSLLTVGVGLAAALFGLIGVMNLINADYMRLETSPQGLGVRAVGWSAMTPWENVGRVGVRWGEECLFLNRPAVLRGWAASPAHLFGYDRYIALAPYGDWWSETPLAADLRMYLPDHV